MPATDLHQPTLDIVTRSLVCRQCGEPFTAGTIRIAGSNITPNYCGRCSGPEEPTPQNTGPNPEDFAAIGVNVRCHARSSLADLEPLPALHTAATDFVAEAHEAGRWGWTRGLLLCGQTGVGKTHAAVAIIRGLLLRGVPASSIIFDRASRLITEIQDTYGSGGTAAVLRRREKARLWVLDDLGAEKATPDALRILHDLLDAREGHPNVITSNFTPDEMGRRFAEQNEWARIASRLGTRNYRIIRVAGEDRRFTGAA